MVPVRESHLVYIENIKNKRVGVARVKSESLAATTECCGPDNVLQSLLSKLRVQDSVNVRVYITGGGPPEMLPHIADIIANWGISRGQVNYDGVHDKELGIGSLDPEKPEQNWVTIRQIQP